MKLLPALLPIALAACYGAAPPKPPQVPLPPIADGAPIEVHSETKTTIEQVNRTASSCPQGHGEGDPACVVTHYTEPEPVTRTNTAAFYGGQSISYAQFRVMTDPKWNEKLVTLDELSHKCTRANVPRYAGMGIMLGGLIAGSLVGGTAGQGILYGGLAGGAASYALGYFAFGGRDCVEAQNLFNQLDMSRAMGWTTVEGADYAQQMKELADSFNSAHAGRSALNMR